MELLEEFIHQSSQIPLSAMLECLVGNMTVSSTAVLKLRITDSYFHVLSEWFYLFSATLLILEWNLSPVYNLATQKRGQALINILYSGICIQKPVTRFLFQKRSNGCVTLCRRSIEGQISVPSLWRKEQKELIRINILRLNISISDIQSTQIIA